MTLGHWMAQGKSPWLGAEPARLASEMVVGKMKDLLQFLQEDYMKCVCCAYSKCSEDYVAI